MASQNNSQLIDEQIKNNSSYMFIQNEQSSKQDLDQSFDLLIAKDNSQSNKIDRSYLQSHDVLDKSKEEIPSNNVQKKTLFERIKEYMKGFYNQELQKSSPILLIESTLFGSLGIITSFMNFLYVRRIKNLEGEYKTIQERVKKIKSNSSKIFSDCATGQNILIYGKATQQNTSKYTNVPYVMYNLNFLDNQKYQACEFPKQKNVNIKEKAYTIIDYTSALKPILAYQLGTALQFSLENMQLNNGENVFIFGTKLANSSILPTQIFKNIDFSKIEKLIKNLKIEEKFLGIVGAAFFLVCSYKFYVFLHKKFNELEEEYGQINNNNQKKYQLNIDFKFTCN
ncbi:transmembrane protein, putative (macronuclear) [Tetrahymena thermophila SB210]|uniref:Transmembrane protein, putative n=1 Tax=Tetrahymena thermophila (strain SB210) TaxID=312017 RepID=I7M282_TETTS|nr:transmembrane protein, putative [Tetrahymena thermophila SB210]EAR99509.1 transmembrane protein, putative [Tetrahymena thermophila SB210]|eukprot:XP_001019754.1 transmembrane protein, putative [Tetrahymena thermophila SB210]